ncbi:MAG: peptide ABC transporter substrate-binding protein [Chloroflexota bacterium]
MYSYIKRLHNSRSVPILALLLVTSLAAACGLPLPTSPTLAPDASSPTRQAPPTEESTPLPTPTSTPTPTPTPLPPKHLAICQGEEPDSLFVYAGLSPAARNVLAAIYDGPIDTRTYQPEPVILESLPTLDNGGAALLTVEVGEGDTVLDADGEVVELAPNVTLHDTAGEPITFQGGVITTTQIVVTFTVRADVTWADGEPLTAADSRYSYEVADALQDASLGRQVSRTASYELTDERTVVWTGVPGYRDTTYTLNFYHPLPQHALEGIEAQQLPQSDVARRQPLGWGPFVLDEWVEGERITLLPNPHYFRAPEGLPHLDSVTFRFVDDVEQATDGLLAGECHIITRDLAGEIPPEPLLDAVEAGQARLISAAGSEWEHLDFGVNPAPWSQQMPYFADAQVRQAVAHCTDRERIAREAFGYAEGVLAHSYVSPDHPLYAADQLHTWPYDPAAGRALLEAAGWRDADGDGFREAQDLPGITSGTSFSVTLLTTAGDPARERTTDILTENLADCGIRMGVRYIPPGTFYADGPDGPVFGRQFDLALFSWLNGLDAPCQLYLSTQIPNEDNWWATSNNPGYHNEVYDQACYAALTALYGTEAHQRNHREAQAIFSRDLPVLPLYFVPRLLVVSPRVTGVTLDPSQQTPFWNIESFDMEW